MTGNNPFARATFLRGLAEELDPSPERKSRARDRYMDLGAYLRAVIDDNRDVYVYPQGSSNIGTSNVHPETGEFDVDLVIAPSYRKTELTQRQLNEKVGGWLKDYVATRQEVDHPLAPVGIEPGKRAWTLLYDDAFHMDVLAVVPDLDFELPDRSGEPSWLTDKQLFRWQATNPQGFAEWFREVSKAEFVKRKELVAKRAEVDVDKLPDDQVKTTLQEAVQVLKRHKDHMFRDDEARLAPPSALITAVAAKAYAASGLEFPTLDAVLELIVGEFERHFEWRNGDLWVPNPRCDRENYADRYQNNPDKKQALSDWIEQAQSDLGRVSSVHGTPVVAKALDEVFGRGLGGRVVKRIGVDSAAARAAGTVGSTATGTLSTASGTAHRDHDFYGQPAS